MAKTNAQFDALVLGEHPAAYLAAAMLRVKGKLRVAHATIPDDRAPDRLVLVNPELFDLHESLSPLKKKIPTTSVYGLEFLSDNPATRSVHRGKAAIGAVAHLKDIRQAMLKLAEAQDVQMLTPKTLEIHQLDETGVDISVGKTELRAKVLVIGGTLGLREQKTLGIEPWGRDVLHRYTFVKIKNARAIDLGNRAVLPMSLDLKGMLSWAWAMTHDGQIQLAIEQPLETVSKVSPTELLAHWAQVLKGHQILNGEFELPKNAVESIDLPLAGALVMDGVVNRALLIGPAGGFFAATGEDIYPNCWSAIYAADCIKKALREPHLQDALQPFRHKWRTTLGDYLRGPQQNLRFLLPLVYRNQVMTDRLTDSILMGKSVVR